MNARTIPTLLVLAMWIGTPGYSSHVLKLAPSSQITVVSQGITKSGQGNVWTIKWETALPADRKTKWIQEIMEVWKHHRKAIDASGCKYARLILSFADNEETNLGSYKYEHLETVDVSKDQKGLWHSHYISWGLPDPMP